VANFMATKKDAPSKAQDAFGSPPPELPDYTAIVVSGSEGCKYHFRNPEVVCKYCVGKTEE
jgi:putative intracellular protease/amidase